MNHRSIWEMIIARGIILTLLGIVILAWPTFTLMAAVTVLGIFLLAAGVIGAIKGIFDLGSGWAGIGELILAVLAFILGLAILRHPGVALVTYVILLGIWFILRGIFEVFNPLKDRSLRVFHILIGILSIALGILLLNRPISSGIALIWVVGIYALITGPMYIITALMLRTGQED